MASLHRYGVWCLAAFALVSATASRGGAGDRRPLMLHVSRDTTTAPAFQHETEVEPAIAAGGRALVTVFQMGRSRRHGAAAIGFASSLDGGRSWHQGVLPPLTRADASPSSAVDITDPVVAYDRVHAVWLATSIASYANGSRTLQVHRSPDGLEWSAPVAAATGVLDREAVTCDAGAKSSFRGRCYLVFTRENIGRLGVRWSDDGGSTWSHDAAIPAPLGGPTGAAPLVRASGRLLVVFRQGGGKLPNGASPPLTLSAARSADGAEAFSPAAPIARVQPYSPPHFRGLAMATPSVAAVTEGRVFVIWHSCRFRHLCRGNDLALASSNNGVRWSSPRRLPLDRHRDNVIPALAVAPGSRGRHARLGVTYYAIRSDSCRPAKCTIAPAFTISTNGGRSWKRPLRLHVPMRFTWLAQAPKGHAFVGDYIGTTFVGDTAWAVFPRATRPTRGRLHEGIAVARVRPADVR